MSPRCNAAVMRRVTLPRPKPPHRRASQWSCAASQLLGQARRLSRLRRHARAQIENYLDSGHPLQQRIRTTMARFAQGDPIAQGIDGCSAPNFAMPLRRLAQTVCADRRRRTPEMHAITFTR